MDFNRLMLVEEKIKKGQEGSYVSEPFSIPVKNETITLDGITIRPKNGFTGYYEKKKVTKEKIVLHNTVGHLKGDLSSLMSEKRGRVSVPFVIARDGTIYQLFSSSGWSYHLGRSAIGGNEIQSQKSVGIELSNYGPLTMRDGNLETAYSRAKLSSGKEGRADIYCSKTDTELYTKLDSPFRGNSYFATCTDAQYKSLIILLRYLTAEYDIPRNFLSEDVRYEATDQVIDFKGILSHVNYRVSGKWDIGPAFDWERVISGLQANSFSSGAQTVTAIAKLKAEIRQAKTAATKAQNKVLTLEQELAELQESSQEEVGTRSLASSPKYSSEAAIEKNMPRQRGMGLSTSKSKQKTDGEGPDDDKLKASFYR